MLLRVHAAAHPQDAPAEGVQLAAEQATVDVLHLARQDLVAHDHDNGGARDRCLLRRLRTCT